MLTEAFIEQGTFEAKGYYFDASKIPLAIIPSGDYAGEIIGTNQDGVVTLHAKGYVSIVNI